MPQESTKDRAREFAVFHHADQRYGEHSYSVHLEEVALLCEPYGSEAVVVAWLHDVVEDTDVTLKRVEQEFGERVAACVAILSDEPGASRKERKARTYAKMAKVEGELELALIVKTADRLANVTASSAGMNKRLLGIYRREHATFRNAAYRKGLCDELWIELDALIRAATSLELS